MLDSDHRINLERGFGYMVTVQRPTTVQAGNARAQASHPRHKRTTNRSLQIIVGGVSPAHLVESRALVFSLALR